MARLCCHSFADRKITFIFNLNLSEKKRLVECSTWTGIDVSIFQTAGGNKDRERGIYMRRDLIKVKFYSHGYIGRKESP